MNPFHSLRARVILGSILWTAGLLALSHLLFMTVFRPMSFVMHTGKHAVLIIAPILMAAGLAGLRSGLTPFRQLRKNLTAVRDGTRPRIEGDYPNEVAPLVSDLNTLLDHRERIVKRALATAGDLAHGLKTPLAVLTQEAERAEAVGQVELASAMLQQVERMRRQVDYHLARARAAASGATPGAHCAVAESAEGLARTLRRLYAGRGLSIEVQVAADHAVRAQREDLDEMLGNLLDNACKWAKNGVVLESTQQDGAIFITVDDDGSGIAPAMREAVLKRGVRADEAAPGSGFGLAIVRDLAELYGGAITLACSARGGLQARLRLPRC